MVAYVADIETFYIKFEVITTSAFVIRFVEAKFNGKKLLPNDDTEVMSARQGKMKFKQKHPDLKAKNFILCWR